MLLANLAGSCGALAHLCGFRVWVMAGKALGIIKHSFTFWVFMRIMTRCTTDSPIIGVVTAAVGKPIRLETEIIDIVYVH